MFDLNMDVINNIASSHNNNNNNNNNNNGGNNSNSNKSEDNNKNSIIEENLNNNNNNNSATNTELSGTSSASSLVNGADESPISGEFDFFSKPSRNDDVSPPPSFVTRQLFPMNDDSGKQVVEIDNTKREMELFRIGSSSSSGIRTVQNQISNTGNQWLNLSVLGSGSGSGLGIGPEQPAKQQVRRSRRGPRSRSSQYRGVTFYRRTGRWESHIWDCGKQVYLGGFDTAHAAARAYDRAAIKFRGVDADINFGIADYEDDMNQMKNLTKEEFVHILRRQSTGFSRGSSRYRGVTLHKCGRWEARMGQFLGKKAYDKAALQCNGTDAVTNFEPGSYESQIQMMQANNEADAQNLDLNLGISITLSSPKGNNVKGAGESQAHQHPSMHLANGKWPVNGNPAYYTPGAPALYGQPMGSRQSTTMWSGLPPGRSANYEDIKINDPKLEAIAASGRLPNWAWYMQSQGQGQGQGQGGSGGGVGGTANQVQLLSTAASSGFSSFSPATASSASYPFTLQSDVHTNSSQGHGKS